MSEDHLDAGEQQTQAILQELVEKIASLPAPYRDELTPALDLLQARLAAGKHSSSAAPHPNLEEQRAMVKSFYENSPFTMGVAELEGDTIVVLSGSSAVAEMFDVSPDEIVAQTGRPVNPLMEEHGIWLDHFRRSQRERKPVQFEYERPGQSRWQWLSATVMYLGTGSQGRPRFNFIAEDITERKRAELELLQSERVRQEANERFRTSIENLNEAFMIFSAVREANPPAEGKIVDFRWEYVNQATCLMYQLRADQINGRTILELFPEQAAMGIIARYARVVETGQPLVERVQYDNEGDAGPVIRGVFDLRASKFGDGVIVTANDITEQVRLAAEHQEAQVQMEIHRQLAEQRENERQSFAREIHDGPIQSLSSLAFQLQYLKEVYPDPELQSRLDEAALSVKGAVQELRQVMNELRPPHVIRFGLARAIRLHADELCQRYPQITWSFKLDHDGALLPESTCLALYRIYQEAVNNVLRHSEATQVRVMYRLLPDHVTLEIRDNGKGFAQTQDIVALTKEKHFGLAGISERVEAIHGEMEIQSQPGVGTSVWVKAPIPHRNPEVS